MPPNLSNAITAGYNFEWLAFSTAFALLMAAVAFKEYRNQNVSGVYFAAGACLMELSLATHRTFWFVSVLLAPDGFTFAPEIVKHKWILYFDIQLAVVGMAFMARSVLKQWLEGWWFVGPLIVAQGVFAVGFLVKIV